MRNLVRTFARSEDGAITVDWVVLTGLIVGLNVFVLLTPMREALVGVAEAIGLRADEVGERLK